MGTKKLEAILDTYGALQAAIKAQAAAYAAERAALVARIDPAIREALAQLEAEEAAGLAELHAQLAAVASTVKRLVPAIGHSIKGQTYQAVYTPGRPLWNDEMLQGYAMAHPEIRLARSDGEPSVSLRPLKAKETP